MTEMHQGEGEGEGEGEGDLHGLETLESVGDQELGFIPGEEDTDLWIDGETGDFLLGGGGGGVDSSIFYLDFPPLPELPCISSSSSSSPSQPVNDAGCSSSSSSFSSNVEFKKNEQPPWTTAYSMEISQSFDNEMDCINVIEKLGDMDLDIDGFWEPNSMFSYQEEEQIHQEDPQDERLSEDLGMVFLEWLKSNKDSISAEDLRSIKLKKSTIECAAQRLGGGKEGMKQLLKLILEWVQNHHLHKRCMGSGVGGAEMSSSPQHFHPLQCLENPNPISPDSHLSFPTSTPWIPHQRSFYADPPATVGFHPRPGYMGGGPGFPASHFFYCDYPMIDNAATWHPPSPHSHFTLYRDHQHLIPAPPPLQVYNSGSFGNQYSGPTQMVEGNGERLVKMGSSATKEARKKRMARQRRFFSNHRSQNHIHRQHQRSSTAEQHARLDTDANCTTLSHENAGGSNWVFCPSTAAATAAAPPSDVPPPSSDRPTLQPHHQPRQGSKPEKNLRFLLQKVLKQSDVGDLGRIVLPKKEAEMHLPELEARDGISIAMEDIGTSRIWNMRYRFWPNNKSRMYLLENTGDFVRSNGLQEGDFIVIYSDVKSGKYLIRGVKVQQPGSKMEAKRTGKQQRNLRATLISPAGDGSGTPSFLPAK